MTHTWLNTSSYYLTIYQYFSQDVTHFHVVLILKNKHPFLGEDDEMLKLSYKEDYAVMNQKTLCQKSMEEGVSAKTLFMVHIGITLPSTVKSGCGGSLTGILISSS